MIDLMSDLIYKIRYLVVAFLVWIIWVIMGCSGKLKEWSDLSVIGVEIRHRDARIDTFKAGMTRMELLVKAGEELNIDYRGDSRR